MMIKSFFKNAKIEENKLLLVEFSLKERLISSIGAYVLSAVIYLWAFIVFGNLCLFAYYINYFILGLCITAYLFVLTAEIFKFKILKEYKDLSQINLKYFYIELAVFLLIFITIIYFIAINIVGVFL